MPTTDENLAWLERYKKSLEDRALEQLENASDIIDQFKETAATAGVFLGTDAFSYVQTIGIVASAPGLAEKLLSIPPSPKDGLYEYDEIAKHLPPDNFLQGYFIGKNYMLMAAPCFRRSMDPQANWAPQFVDIFWQLDIPNTKKYIAIDRDRVRINVDGTRYDERDYWYGPKFNEDIRKIKCGIVKLAPPPELEAIYLDFLFSNAYCLDVQWSESKSIKTFQALEMKSQDFKININDQIYFPARYLHAEFDISAETFRHFDGAIQYFTEEEYLLRRDSDFHMSSKSLDHIKARSKKVFKINGEIPIEIWVELCGHFFAANPLIHEYFTGSYPDSIADAIEKLCPRKS